MLKFQRLTKSHLPKEAGREKSGYTTRKSRQRKLQREGFNVSYNYKKKENTHFHEDQ